MDRPLQVQPCRARQCTWPAHHPHLDQTTRWFAGRSRPCGTLCISAVSGAKRRRGHVCEQVPTNGGRCGGGGGLGQPSLVPGQRTRLSPRCAVFRFAAGRALHGRVVAQAPLRTLLLLRGHATADCHEHDQPAEQPAGALQPALCHGPPRRAPLRGPAASNRYRSGHASC